jgi:hypothetical protein
MMASLIFFGLMLEDEAMGFVGGVMSLTEEGKSFPRQWAFLTRECRRKSHARFPISLQ